MADTILESVPESETLQQVELLSVETALPLPEQQEGGHNQRELAVALAGFSAFLHLYATQSLLPLLTQVFAASEAAASLTVSATTVAVGLTAPAIGVLADRLGRKRVIVASALGLCLPTWLAATAADLPQLIGWRFAQGLFMPAIFAVTVAYVGEECAGSGVGRAMAAYVTGNILGGVCGRFLAGAIAADWGWRWAFVLLGCINLVTGAAIWHWLPPSQRFRPERTIGTSARVIGQHLRDPRLRATYAVGFGILFTNVSTFTYVSFHLAAPPFQLGIAALGSIFFVYLPAAAITPLAGQWIDWIGYRLALVAAIATAAVGVTLTLVPSLGLTIAGLAIAAAGVFVCQSAANSYVSTVTHRARSAAAGLYVAFYYLGGSLGALLPGLVWPWGGWPACVALIVAVQGMTAAIAFRGWRPQPTS